MINKTHNLLLISLMKMITMLSHNGKVLFMSITKNLTIVTMILLKIPISVLAMIDKMSVNTTIRFH